MKSLYPSIPTALGLDYVKTILEKSNHFTDKKIHLIIRLMHWILTNNFIIFDGEVYRQIEGTAMGTPMAPTYAILFMFAIERHHIQQALYYVHYIDDIFAIFPSVEHITVFTDAINSAVPGKLQLDAAVNQRAGSAGEYVARQFQAW